MGDCRKSKVSKYEKNLIYWIIDCRKLGISVSTRSIIGYIYSQFPEIREINYHNL